MNFVQQQGLFPQLPMAVVSGAIRQDKKLNMLAPRMEYSNLLNRKREEISE